MRCFKRLIVLMPLLVLVISGSVLFAWCQFFDFREISNSADSRIACGLGWPVVFAASPQTTLPRTNFTAWSTAAFVIDIAVWLLLAASAAYGLSEWLFKRQRSKPCFWTLLLTALLSVGVLDSGIDGFVANFEYSFHGFHTYSHTTPVDFASGRHYWNVHSHYGYWASFSWPWFTVEAINYTYVLAAAYGAGAALLDAMRRWKKAGAAILIGVNISSLLWVQFIGRTSMRGAENRWGSGWLWTVGRPWQYFSRLENRWPPKDWDLDDFRPWALAADIAAWLLAIVFSCVAIRRLHIQVQPRLSTMFMGFYVIALFLAAPDYYRSREYVATCLFVPALLVVGLAGLGFCFCVLDWIVRAEQAFARRRAERNRPSIAAEQGEWSSTES